MPFAKLIAAMRLQSRRRDLFLHLPLLKAHTQERLSQGSKTLLWRISGVRAIWVRAFRVDLPSSM